MSGDTEKERFLKEYGHDYGYPNAPKNIDEIRATEFKRLNDVVYLDHAGATLYSEAQMEAILKDLNSTVYANPHSQSNCSLVTSDAIAKARQQVLSFFNASPGEYSCIFTSGATAALKLVGETFPWSSCSSFMYTMENHNSVLGIREYSLSKGAKTYAVDFEEPTDKCNVRNPECPVKIIKHRLQRSRTEATSEEPTGSAYSLFAFPSECNFTGLRFNLELVKSIKENSSKFLDESADSRRRWMFLIDAAKGSATNPPDLSKFRADFVVVSFYKLFGYPTGLGALIVHHEAAKLMKKIYFSGGTVAASIADFDLFRRREGVEEFFEDGTISFLSISSIHHGFKILNTLTLSAISRHTVSLNMYVRTMLSDLRHENGSSVCTIYGVETSKVFNEIGPVTSFNLKGPDGSWYGYREVEKLASLSGIQLRTGCFCNPGACTKYLGLSHLDMLSNIEAGHICWDDQDVLNGKPTGAVRVSFGYMSTFEDARKFVNFVRNSFMPHLSRSMPVSPFEASSVSPTSEDIEKVKARYFLRSVTIYPIKSCEGFTVRSWPLSGTGLLHDREWVLKSTSGEIFTQKKVPDMCYITTLIDLNLGILFVESPRCKSKLQIQLKSDLFINGGGEVDVHAQRYEVLGYSNEVDNWFSQAIGRPCTLLRNSSFQHYGCPNRKDRLGLCSDFESRLNFVNEAQFLLISEESVADLNNRLKSNTNGQQIRVNTSRFRPNLVVYGGDPYEEDRWSSLKIGSKYFKSIGGCNRCQMINMNFESGEVQRSREPLATLAAYRRVKGRITFGILLRHEVGKDPDSWLSVGEEVFPDEVDRDSLRFEVQKSPSVDLLSI